MKRTIALALLISLTATAAYAQFFFSIPVFDATNFANAVERLFQLEQQYSQLVTTYKQLVIEYEHMKLMAQRLPNLWQHRFSPTAWRFSQSTNTYGTTAGWTQGINTGIAVAEGYRQAVERLALYGSAYDRIPADQIDRARSDYATIELADAANLHGMEVLGAQRAKARTTESAISTLEAVTLDETQSLNTQVAVLNKINATNMMALRAGQDTNQLLVSLLEQQITEAKARRDAEASVINTNIAIRQNALDAGMQGVQGTTEAITAFRIP